MKAAWRALFAALALAALAGCRGCGTGGETVKSLELVPAASLAEVAEGSQLLTKFECNRCHDGLPNVTPAVENKHCTHCHANILSGAFKASEVDFQRWSKVVAGLEDAPSLTGIGERYHRSWIAGYLAKPTHLRPRLVPHMPRLDITEDEARALAAVLAPGAERDHPDALIGASAGRGKQLFEQKACGTCHSFTGADVANVASEIPVAVSAPELARGMKLAPDLRVTRARMTKRALVAWLRAPKSVKPDTTMPDYGLAEADAKDIAAFVLDAPLAEVKKTPLARLPLLERKVTFAEVDEHVLHKTCWHCHSDPDLAIGDGGPGNSGGFGFRGRGLDLGSYAGVRTGILEKKSDERKSILKKDNSLLVQSLLARHAEEAGEPTGSARGMPLGYPPLSAIEIQLVESWVAQGAPR